MLATPVVVQSGSKDGPRPINPRRDIRQVLELLDLAFGPILDGYGRRVLDTRASFQYQASFVMRLNLVGKGMVPGFVWEENGRIIGNVSLMQSEIPGRFLIANVAVHPDHRRRGVGRMLMQEALAYIQSLKATEVVLQVEQANTGAIELYRNLGFDILGTNRRWEISTRRLRNLPLSEAEGNFDIRPLKGADWSAAYHIDRAALNPNIRWPTPITADHYKTGLWQRIADFLNGRKNETWTISIPASDQRNKQLVGLATISSEWGRPHNIELRVLPSWQGQLERPLLAKVIRRLRYLKQTTINVDHPSDDAIVNILLQESNFQTKRYLTFMHLSLRG